MAKLYLDIAPMNEISYPKELLKNDFCAFNISSSYWLTITYFISFFSGSKLAKFSLSRELPAINDSLVISKQGFPLA